VKNASGLVWGFDVALNWQPAWCAVVMAYGWCVGRRG
jgi:hypothetical protein